MTIYLDSLDSYYSNNWLFDPSMTITEFDFLHETNTNPEFSSITNLCGPLSIGTKNGDNVTLLINLLFPTQIKKIWLK